MIEEQREIQLNGKQIAYTLRRSTKRRSIGLQIQANRLQVSVPHNVSEKWLHQVLQNKAAWIVEKISAPLRANTQTISYVDGELLPFLGENQILLCIQLNNSTVASDLQGDTLLCQVRSLEQTKHLVKQWYQQQALSYFSERLQYFAQRMHVTPRQLHLSDAKTRWGSCNSAGVIRLNWQLIKLAPKLIDYVVVHELAHLEEMNHSADFWRKVDFICPDYKTLRQQLKSIRLEH